MKNIFNGIKLKKRITQSKGWTIVIDDGYVSYLFKLNASNKYSINSLFNKISKQLKKDKNVKI